MPDFALMQHHARAHQIRRCLQAMSDEQIDSGLTAFDNGASSWSNCFWARVFEGFDLYKIGADGYTAKRGDKHRSHYAIEWFIADRLGLESNMPVRIVYNLFDGDGVRNGMSRGQLRDFIHRARLEGDHDPQVLQLLAELGNDVESAELVWSGGCSP